MKKLIPLGLVALLAAAAAIAQPAPPAGPPHGAKALANYLQLTQDQISAWQQIEKDAATAVQPLAENARDLRMQLQTALDAATPDPVAVGNLAISLHSVESQIRSIREDAEAKRIVLLTPDQKVKFDAFQAAVQFLRARNARPGR